MVVRVLQLAGKALRRKVLSARFVFFALPWLIVLAAPPLRQLFFAHLFSSTISGWVLPGLAPTHSEFNDGWEYSGLRLARAHPNNLDAQVLAIDDEPTRQAGLRAFDRLIERYPDQIWLIAERLRRTDFDLGLKMSAPAAITSPAPPVGPPGAPAPGRPPAALLPTPTPIEVPPVQARPHQTIPANLEQALKLARLGRAREPDNAFFDWRLVEGLLLMRREQEAFAVLHEAALKPYFDAHRRESVRSHLAALALVRPLLLEEKVQVTNERLDYSFDYQLSRALLWHAGVAKRRGDHARALGMYGDVMGLMARVRDNRDDVETNASPYEVWRRAVAGTPFDKGRLARGTPPGTSLKHRALQFAAYARHYGRGDLATDAIRQAELSADHIMRSQGRFTFLWSYGQVISQDQMLYLLVLAFVAMGIGSCALLLIALRWCVYFPLWVPGLTGKPLRRRDLWLTASEYFVLTIAAVVYVLWPRSFAPTTNLFLDALAMAMTTFCPLLLLLSPITCAAVTVWRHRAEIFAPQRLATDGRSAMVPRSLLPVFLTAVSWFAIFTAAICWLAAPIVYKQPGQVAVIPLPPALRPDSFTTTTTVGFQWVVVAAALLSTVCYIGWLIRWRWLAPAHLKPIAHYALRWHLKSLGDWTIVLCYAYVCVLLLSLPPRRAADASLQRFLEQGRLEQPNTSEAKSKGAR